MRTAGWLGAVGMVVVFAGCLDVLIPGNEAAVGSAGEPDLAVAPGDDGGGGLDDPDGGTAQSACIDPAAPLVAPQDHEHGQVCQSCHDGQTNVLWTVAGTVFQAADSTVGVGGATVEVIDANGKVVRMVTTAGGNFFTDEALVLPLRVRATACPADRAMPDPAVQGSCNTAGCHSAGQRIHLP